MFFFDCILFFSFIVFSLFFYKKWVIKQVVFVRLLFLLLGTIWLLWFSSYFIFQFGFYSKFEYKDISDMKSIEILGCKLEKEEIPYQVNFWIKERKWAGPQNVTHLLSFGKGRVIFYEKSNDFEFDVYLKDPIQKKYLLVRRNAIFSIFFVSSYLTINWYKDCK